MSELTEKLALLLEEKPLKIVLSNGSLEEVKKIVLTKEKEHYAVEKFTDKQVFHDRMLTHNLSDYLESLLENHFKQLNAFSDGREFMIKISKKKKVFFSASKGPEKIKVKSVDQHKKKYYLEEGEVIAPLIDMGVFTKDGKVVSQMYDKYRQINKFIQFIDEAVEKSGKKKLNIIDFGCGKSYLTFVVYYYLKFKKNLEIKMLGMDLKEDVIKKCQETAKRYGYENLSFLCGNIFDYETDEHVDMVITLHACDIATDFALFHAMKWNTDMIISVPCCQHELNAQIESKTYHALTRYGLIKERMSALMTDAIRANLLEYMGYKTQILEFVDFSHTPKNLMIRSVKSNITKEHKEEMLQEVRNLILEYHLDPTLYRMMKDENMLK